VGPDPGFSGAARPDHAIGVLTLVAIIAGNRLLASERAKPNKRCDMSHLNADLNATPLIDVFLVLLVMLIITVPLATHKISMDLPGIDPGSQPAVQSVDIDIDFDDRVFWNGMAVANDADLMQRFKTVSRAVPVKVWPDSRARYERVAQVLAAAQRAHVTKLSLSPVGD
jgi:biopolymer transport protein ExbD